MLAEKLLRREHGLCVYGITPPKQATLPDALTEIARTQRARVAKLGADGLIVYDIQDESDRNAEPRPFPFFPLRDAARYAEHELQELDVDKIVYRCVQRIPESELVGWLREVQARPEPSLAVLVGASSKSTLPSALKLSEANALARAHAPKLVLGGVAIAERHARRGDEHERLVAKMAQGSRFFVSQTVYDASSMKSLLSDYALLLAEKAQAPVPMLLSFAPCGSLKTLEFMKWLGIRFPRWLENELRFARDPLEASLGLCERIFLEVWDFARKKGLPLGVNVESVSIRKAEIDASTQLVKTLRTHTQRSLYHP